MDLDDDFDFKELSSDSSLSGTSLPIVSFKARTRSANQKKSRPTKTSILFRHIFNHIKLLYTYSSLFRRPNAVARYLKSSQPINDRGLGRPGFYELSHILEKLQLWNEPNGLKNMDLNLETERWRPIGAQEIAKMRQKKDEELVPEIYDIEPIVDQGLVEQRLNEEFDITALSHRLAYANMQRREQLTYWKMQPSSNDNLVGENNLPAVRKAIMIEINSDEASSVREQNDEPTVKELPRKPNSESNTTVKLSNIPASVLFESHAKSSHAPLRTRYEKTVIGGFRPPVPPPPRTEELFFRCDYCFMKLDTSDMQVRDVWK